MAFPERKQGSTMSLKNLYEHVEKHPKTKKTNITRNVSAPVLMNTTLNFRPVEVFPIWHVQWNKR